MPDAHELPSAPGVGLLKAGTEKLVRFRASHVAAPPPPRALGSADSRCAGGLAAAIRVLPFTAAPVLQLE